LRERTPVSLLRRLRVAEDMHAFTRSAEREGRLLRTIAANPAANLVVAYTPAGEIVGEVTMAPADGRWTDMAEVYEVAVQVARSWRGTGLGQTLLRFTVEPAYTQSLILIALGVAWHWDLEAMNLSPRAYREILLRTFAPAGFRPFTTDDPEILAAEGNVLVARIGAEVSVEIEEEFQRRLLRRRSWYGF
jgi:GNAT superfamily N-acetyltransferase